MPNPNSPKSQYPNIPPFRIVFFGSPPFATPVLKKLQEEFDVLLDIGNPQQLNSEKMKQLGSLGADFFVVASFGKIIPNDLLSIPKLGSINIHPSILPKYRGPSPIQTAILNKDKTTGVTFFKMDEKLDHGPIIQQFEELIRATDTFESLANRLFENAADVLVRVLTRHDAIKNAKPQDDSKATYTKLLTKNDGYIDISNPPNKHKLELMIRAYFPWPGVWTKYKLIDKEQIIKLLPEDKIQVEGKKTMSYKDFINGYPNGEKFLRAINLIPN